MINLKRKLINLLELLFRFWYRFVFFIFAPKSGKLSPYLRIVEIFGHLKAANGQSDFKPELEIQDF